MGEEFYIQTLIQFVVTFLAATVKNPASGRAQRLRYYVQKAYDAFGSFLAQTDPARLQQSTASASSTAAVPQLAAAQR